MMSNHIQGGGCDDDDDLLPIPFYRVLEELTML